MLAPTDPASTPVEVDCSEPPASPAVDDATRGLAALRPRRGAERLASLIEVMLCSGFPTQLSVMLGLATAGLSPVAADGGLSLSYITLLSLVDTVVLVSLIALFVRVRRDDWRALFLGARPVWREAGLGLALVPLVLLSVALLMAAVLRYAPWLHNVGENPLASLFRNGRDIAIFAFVVVVAGGAREEIQRAFILNRFARDLGGARFGLVLFSVLFGLGHLLQGFDAALATGLLGLVWGVLYLSRGSVIAPMVCHAMFNLTEVIHYGLAG